ncbi:ribonuclease H family protein [Ureibacillus chungkukjangi]|uniref:ribonuclease H family protein n=1 Tax=Ureibacillus chungkukjangi TaxID=1202712 RepID=UPI00203DDF8C|nr:ribonuclease H family protein [Ureibacillus chungkukjangi]MCM3388425.1 ribonuclease H family protein [Ureibacillus chungkukjangi]
MKITIEWTYKTKNGIETVFRSDEMPPAHALSIGEDLEKTGRAKKLQFIDQNDSTWLAKELKKYIKEIDTEPHNVRVYFDGGYDIQTKNAGLGIAIYYEQNGKSYRLRRNAPASGLNSNNEAEYAALHLAIVELDLLDVHHQTVQFLGDSQVVINQMSGEWPAYEKDLASWADRIDEKLNELGITPEFELVPRKLNSEADRLATQSLQGVGITGQIELQ